MRIVEINKALVLSVVVILLSFGCATMKSEGAATLHVDCNVPDAAVLLDDALVGRVADVAKKDKVIRAGFYRVEIRHPQYHSYFTEITVAEGAVAAVKADLHPLLD
jgi:hypothetical protein